MPTTATLKSYKNLYRHGGTEKLMYCVNCGVKLENTEKICPLCKTEVYHPSIDRQEGEPLYPKNEYPQKKRTFKWPQVLLTALFLIPVVIVLMCDIRFSGGGWSGYVIGAIFTLYICAVLPSWFCHPNPVIFVPCGFVCMAAYIFYICFMTGGDWYWTFALPVTGGIMLIVTAVVTLMKYVPRGKLYTIGGAVIALGGFMLPTEILLNLTFGYEEFIGWSLYPLVTLLIIGLVILFFAICRPAREDIERRLFI